MGKRGKNKGAPKAVKTASAKSKESKIEKPADKENLLDINKPVLAETEKPELEKLVGKEEPSNNVEILTENEKPEIEKSSGEEEPSSNIDKSVLAEKEDGKENALGDESSKPDVVEPGVESVKPDAVQEEHKEPQDHASIVEDTTKSDVVEKADIVEKSDVVEKSGVVESSKAEKLDEKAIVETQQGKSHDKEKGVSIKDELKEFVLNLMPQNDIQNVDSKSNISDSGALLDSKVDEKHPVKNAIPTVECSFGKFKPEPSDQHRSSGFGKFNSEPSDQQRSSGFGSKNTSNQHRSSGFGNKNPQNSSFPHQIGNQPSNYDQLSNSNDGASKVSSGRKGAGYEWKSLSVSDMSLKRSSFGAFKLRGAPRYFSVNIEGSSHKISHTEYLISYSNGFTAVGMLKNENDIGKQPLTIQFGHWGSQNVSDICTGSVVVVRAYYDISSQSSERFVANSDKEIERRDFCRGGFIVANTIAAEWAVVSKPRLSTSLGTIESFAQHEEKYGVTYTGRVYDQEYELSLDVPNESWSYRMQKAPKSKIAVILTWAEVPQLHVSYTNRDGFPQMLPPYAPNRLRIGGQRQDRYWLVSVSNSTPKD